MNCSRHGLQGILPPYILERLAESPDAEVRRNAREAIEAAAEARTARALLSMLPALAAVPSPRGRKHRLVYDMSNRSAGLLPGKLARSEGERAVKDSVVNEAYNGCGRVYDFYRRIYGRNSLDDRGMSLISSVHVGRKYNNAFWNGVQIAFGDGDGVIFRRFTRSLDVIAHELTHGVISHTCNLVYQGESGALNEHFADVFGILARQWKKKETAAKSDWAIGSEIMGPEVTARGLRTFDADPAFADDPHLGSDPQPKHMDDIYRGESDRGGVHINSGIPNHAFYLFARSLGGAAWERAGRIWYFAMERLRPLSGFRDAAGMTTLAAGELYPGNARVATALKEAWTAVGIDAG